MILGKPVFEILCSTTDPVLRLRCKYKLHLLIARIIAKLAQIVADEFIRNIIQ